MSVTFLTKAQLVSGSTDPDSLAVQAIAGVLAASYAGVLESPDLYLGMADEDYVKMAETLFPGIKSSLIAVNKLDCKAAGERTDEFDDVLLLLTKHAVDDSAETRWIAHALACGCLGGDHLYADMGFDGRKWSTLIFKTYFKDLAEKNFGQIMKWKRFVYKQLCDMAEVKACRAPSCQVCASYTSCYTEDDRDTTTLVAAAEYQKTDEEAPGHV